MRTTAKAIGVGVAALVIAPTLGACGSSSAPAAHGSSRTKPAATVPAGNNGNLVHPVGAIAALSKFTCGADAHGKWSATGIVTNSSSQAAQYLLQAVVIEKKVDTVVGSVQKQFTVAAGHRVEVRALAFYSSKKAGLQCTPRLVKGATK